MLGMEGILRKHREEKISEKMTTQWAKLHWDDWAPTEIKASEIGPSRLTQDNFFIIINIIFSELPLNGKSYSPRSSAG